MSTQVLPALRGLAWDVRRSPMWANTIQVAASGKETRTALWSYPRYEWEMRFNFLRQGGIDSSTEFQQMLAFFNSRQGSFDSFLYEDSDDKAVTNQAIGTGDGTTKTFQLVRAFGGYIEPITAPKLISAVKVNGTNQSFTSTAWGTATPGQITLASAPANGAAITADFTYYWPCRFVDDSLDFSKFMATLWNANSVKFRSIK